MPGSPDVSEFPRNEWAASTRRALSTAPTEALRMGDARGRPELRDALAEYLTRARGVRTTAESIVVCAGVRHGVELLGAGLSRSRPDRRRGIRAVHLPRRARRAGRADGADRRRRARRGRRRTRRPADAGGAADARAPQPVRDAAAPVAAHRRRRMGAAHGRVRLRRRLRRRVPLRPSTDRCAAGVVPRPGGLPGVGEQEPVAGAAAGLDGVARQPD